MFKLKIQISYFLILFFFTLLVHGMASGAEEEREQTISFGVYAADKPTEVYKKFRPILDAAEQYISKQTGRSIEIDLVIHQTYEETVDQLARGQIDFARLGPASYILAKKANPNIHIMAVELEKGGKIFYGIIFTRQDSPILTLQDLKGKRFAFGNPRSTIGRFLAQRKMLLNGITANSLGSFEYLDRHDQVCAAVLAGDFDAGTAKENTFLKYKNQGAGLREIVRFRNKTKPWVAREEIDTKQFATFQNFLLALEKKELLDHYGVSGFAKGSDNEYAFIREAMDFAKKFEREPKR